MFADVLSEQPDLLTSHPVLVRHGRQVNRVSGLSVPVLRPRLPDASALLPYLQRIDESGTYSNFGPLYREFAERLADHFRVGSDQVALLANGTLALQAAIETVGDVGDSWVSPSWTFVATGQAILSARRRVHFADVEEHTWALAPEHRPFARGQVVVAPFGDRPRLSSWSTIPSFKVFDAASCFDACEGIGPELDERSILMVSLHATKPLAAGEGAVLVGPADWVSRASRWGNFGFSGSRIASGPGMNAKISEYHCAVGLASLDQWPVSRVALADLTDTAVATSRSLALIAQPALSRGYVTTTWNVQLPACANPQHLATVLESFGIETRRWWPCGVDQMPAFSTATSDPLPVSRLLASQVLGLPFGPHLHSTQLERVKRILADTLALSAK